MVKPVRSINEIKQKRRGASAPRREGQNRDELSSGNRRVNRRGTVDKSTHAYAQKAVEVSFVSHRGRIIALNHVKSYNLNHSTMGNFVEKATLSSSYLPGLCNRDIQHGKSFYQL
jgi:hypothetical protein